MCPSGGLYIATPFFRGRVSLDMTWVRVKENEPIDSAIRRFKKQCEKAGLLEVLSKGVDRYPAVRHT